MFPVRDDIATTKSAYVNWAVMGLCVLGFATQVMTPRDAPQVSERFGFIPCRVSAPEKPVQLPYATRTDPQTGQAVLITREAAPSAIPPLLTTVTCVFLHAGVMHIFGNLWFLWIFGDNVEERFGHVGFACLYLGTGVFACLCHYVSSPTSSIPTIGASGAIAGVMGAYFVSYPTARVQLVVPLFIVIFPFVLSARRFLAIWLGMQVLGVFQPSAPGVGGVAWWAHIGGFAAGVIVTKIAGRVGLIGAANRRHIAMPRRNFARR